MAVLAAVAAVLTGHGPGAPGRVSAALVSDTSWAADCQKSFISEKIEVGLDKAGNLVELHLRHNVKVRQDRRAELHHAANLCISLLLKFSNGIVHPLFQIQNQNQSDV